MKYELTDEVVQYGLTVLHRVRYLSGYEGLGGWIESERNLTQNSNAMVLDEAKVWGQAVVSGDAFVADYAEVCGDAVISGHACVDGHSVVIGHAKVSGCVRISDHALISGRAEISGDALINGSARVGKKAVVSGRAVISDNAEVIGNVKVTGTSVITGFAQVTGGVWLESPLQIQGTRFFFSVSSKTTLAVGCMNEKVTDWLDSYESYFDKYGFTRAERIEYKLYFNLAATLYKWDVPLFSIDGEGGKDDK